jgi:hypothetical protein
MIFMLESNISVKAADESTAGGLTVTIFCEEAVLPNTSWAFTIHTAE